MKINTADFLVENKIEKATENEIIYDLPKTKIEEAWNTFAEFYTNRLKQENTSEITDVEFFKFLALGRLENENIMEMFELVNKGSIKTSECQDTLEQRFNIKKLILAENIKILDKRQAELKINIEKEAQTWLKIKDLKGELKIVDNEILIFKNAFDFERFEDSITNKEKACLSCMIKYKGVTVIGSSEFLLKKEDISLVHGNYRFNDYGIVISDKKYMKNCSLTLTVLEEIVSGTKVEQIFKNIHILMSRYVLYNLLKNFKEKKVVKTATKVQIDGLSSLFYVITEKGVFKVDRSNSGFQIFLNGYEVLYKTIQ